MLQLSSEFLIGSAASVLLSLLSLVTWLIRLENKTNNNSNELTETKDSFSQKINDVSLASASRFVESSRAIEKNEIRIDRVESRHETNSNEVRTMLMAIQSSLANLEGRLSLNPRRGNNNDER